MKSSTVKQVACALKGHDWRSIEVVNDNTTPGISYKTLIKCGRCKFKAYDTTPSNIRMRYDADEEYS